MTALIAIRLESYYTLAPITYYSQCCGFKGQTLPRMIYNSQKSRLPRGDERTPMPLKPSGLYDLNFRANVSSPPCVMCHHSTSTGSVRTLRSALRLLWKSAPRQTSLVGKKPWCNNKGGKTRETANVTQVPRVGCYAGHQCHSVFLRDCGQTA